MDASNSLGDARLAEAAHPLLDATVPQGHFGYTSRNASTGERELVCAVRGPAADALVKFLAVARALCSISSHRASLNHGFVLWISTDVGAGVRR